MPLCGAPVEAEVDDEVKKHVDHALNRHNESSNEEKKVLVQITKVIKQVVAGMKYTVELVAEGDQSKKRYNCHTILVSQPWIKPEPEIIEFTVKPVE